jgi:hypothetical protein
LELLSRNFNGLQSAENLINALELLKDETIKIMARDQFFRFIQSRHYKKWRAVESSHAMAHTVEDAIGVDIREKSADEMKKIEEAKKKSTTDPTMRPGIYSLINT